MKPYHFFIQYKNRGYQITVEKGLITLTHMGDLTDEDYREIKKYLEIEGFLDPDAKYTII
jgi:hypothetical protein